MVLVFGTPSTIKKVLKESDIYSTFVDNVLKQTQSSVNQSSNNLPLTDPVIQKAAKDSFSPQFLQSSTENVVDGFYHWLTGKSNQPDFKVDLSLPKAKFANSVGDYAVARLNVLPVCTKQQLALLNAEIQPFSIPCKPANINVAAQKQPVVDSLINSKSFLSTTVFTVSSIPKNSQGRAFYQQYSYVPQVYSWLNLSPYLLFVIIGLLGISVILLNDSKRTGVKRVGFAFASTGIFLTASSLVAIWIFKNASKPNGNISRSLNTNGFNSTLTHILDSITQIINGYIIKFGLAYTIIGGLMLLVLLLTRKPKEPAPLESQINTQPPVQT